MNLCFAGVLKNLKGMDVTEKLNYSDRVEWIDCAKGIGILLVVIGHMNVINNLDSLIRGLIFSFHMPLFFILSGYTSRYSSDFGDYKNKCIKSIKKLCGPLFVIFLIGFVFDYINRAATISSIEFTKSKLLTLLMASGVETYINSIHVNALGIPWFLAALLLTGIIYDYLQLCSDKKSLPLNVCIIGMIGVMFGLTQWLPFSLDISIAVIPFIYFGCCLKSNMNNLNSVKSIAVWGGIWLITLAVEFNCLDNWTYLELACRRYNLFPICYITAIAGTMFVCGVSTLICKLKVLKYPLIRYGRDSLLLLTIHAVDYMWIYKIGLDNQGVRGAGYRLAVDLIVFEILMQLRKYIRKLKISSAS